MQQCKLVIRAVLFALFVFTLMAISPVGFSSGTALAQGDVPANITPEPQNPEPSFEFFKLVNSQDANTLDSAVLVETGSTLVFRYEVANTGNITLTWTSLIDDVFGDLTAECGLPREVGVNGVDACDIQRPAEAFPNGRQNIGTATTQYVTLENETIVLDPLQDPAWYRTPPVGPDPNPSFTLTKLVNGNDANTLDAAPLVPVGSPLAFVYQVANTGNVPIEWTTLTDDVFGDLTAECNLPITVQPEESASCDITRPAGDYPEGRQNIGTATVTNLPPQQDVAWYRTPPPAQPTPPIAQPTPVTPPVPIPEPITIVLFGTGLAALSAAAASRRKNQD